MQIQKIFKVILNPKFQKILEDAHTNVRNSLVARLVGLGEKMWGWKEEVKAGVMTAWEQKSFRGLDFLEMRTGSFASPVYPVTKQ